MTKSLLLNVLLVVIGVFLLFRATSDPDFGWHLKYGEYFFNNHKILRENIFSYTFSDYKWDNSYWGAEVVMYVLYKYASPIGLSLILSALLSASFVGILQKLNVKDFVKILTAILFFLFVNSGETSVRPFLFSTIFLLFLIYILIYKPKFELLLPVLFVIWANTHADFTLGLVIYAIRTMYLLIILVKNKELNLKSFFSVVTIPLISLFSTLINPYGFGLWKVLTNETDYLKFSYIIEWGTFDSQKTSALSKGTTLIMLSVILAGAAISYILDKKRFGWWYLVSVAFFFVFSFKSIYFMRIVATLGIFGVIFSGNYIFSNLFRINDRFSKIVGIFTTVFCLMFFAISGQIFAENLHFAQNIESWSQQQKLPYKAITYIKQNPVKGNVFNNYDWGGFLIWQLPQYKTFIDGRMTAWKVGNTRILDDYIKITKDPKTNAALFNDYVKKYNITFVLDKKNSNLIRYLKKQQWSVIYEDNIASVVTLTNSSNIE